MIKIGLVDDKMSNLEVLAEKIETFRDMQIVMRETSGSDFLEDLEQMPADIRPDVVLMDVDMPELDGIKTVARAKTICPEVHFLMFTVFEDDEKIFDAIRAGASGYLLKEEKAESIINAIVQLMETGAVPMSPSVARRTLRLLSVAEMPPKGSSSSPQEEYNLTSRETEILKLLVEGMDIQQIADKLFNSIFTIRKHVANIYGKLHVQSRAAATNLALKNKWFN